MNEERRRLLGIPIHRDEKDHRYVDGYCTCGASEPSKADRKVKSFSVPKPATKGKINLDIIEGNWGEL